MAAVGLAAAASGTTNLGKMSEAVEPAYIQVTPEGDWAVYWGDGSEGEPYILAVGQPFEPGAAMQAAIAELEAWAGASGYTLVTPQFTPGDVPLDRLIEPEIYDDVFGRDGAE